MDNNTLQHIKEQSAQGEAIGDIVRAHAHRYSKEDLITLINEMDYIAKYGTYTDTHEYNQQVIESIEEYSN